MAMNTGFLQQQPLHHTARVHSAPSQQHGAHMWRSPQSTEGEAAPQEEKTFGTPLKR
jgi:hypothetical protein